MKYSGQMKLLCELSKLSKYNAFNLLGYYTNTDGFNMYAEYTQLQLTFLALQLWLNVSKEIIADNLSVNLHYYVVIFTLLYYINVNFVDFLLEIYLCYLMDNKQNKNYY